MKKWTAGFLDGPKIKKLQRVNNQPVGEGLAPPEKQTIIANKSGRTQFAPTIKFECSL